MGTNPGQQGNYREPDLIDWVQLWNWVGFIARAPARHPRLAIAAFLVTTALGVTAGVLAPPRYEVQTVVLARPNPLMGALSNPVSRETAVPTEAARELLARRSNLIALARETRLEERTWERRPPLLRGRDWLFTFLTGKEPDPEDRLEGLVDTLEKRLEVEAHHANTVTIRFRWWDPEIAFDVVEETKRSFLELRRSSEIEAVGEAIAVLERHKTRVREEIEASVARLEAKEEENRKNAPPRRAVPTVLRAPEDRERTRLQTQLASRRRALADLERYRQQRTAELQAELVQQQSVYASNHPAIASTRRLLESLSRPSDQALELQGEVEALERDLARRGGNAAAGVRGGGLDELAEARLFLEGDDPALDPDRRQLSYLLHQYAELLNRVDSAQIELETADVGFKHRYSVVTPPMLPRGPVKSYGLLLAIAGLLGGIALALFAAAAADLWHGRIVERWQVEERLDIPVLGEFRP